MESGGARERWRKEGGGREGEKDVGGRERAAGYLKGPG